METRNAVHGFHAKLNGGEHKSHKWEDILLDPDLEIGAANPAAKLPVKQKSPVPQAVEWEVYTDGSRKGQDDRAYWGFIIKRNGKEEQWLRGLEVGRILQKEE